MAKKQTRTKQLNNIFGRCGKRKNLHENNNNNNNNNNHSYVTLKKECHAQHYLAVHCYQLLF